VLRALAKGLCGTRRNQDTDGDDGWTWRDAGDREPSGDRETAGLAHTWRTGEQECRW
jgi:hypothetical protein